MTAVPLLYGHGEGASTQRGAHVRPRRTAKERREQRLRSDTRMLCRLAKGLTSIQEHRGNTLSSVGRAQRQALQVGGIAKAPTTSGGAMPHNVGAGFQQDPIGMAVCRHWAVGKCTWGSNCRFRHGNDNYEHQYDEESNHDMGDYDDDNHNTSDDGDEDPDYNEDGPRNDNNERQHNHNEQGDQHHGSTPDDIDEIIQVLGVLSQDPEAQQHALQTLPPHLLFEVQTRCEQYDYQQGELSPHDGSNSEEVIDLDDDVTQHDDVQQRNDAQPREDATLDVIVADTDAINLELEAVRQTTTLRIIEMLREHNGNKKHVRRILGNKKLHLALVRSKAGNQNPIDVIPANCSSSQSSGYAIRDSNSFSHVKGDVTHDSSVGHNEPQLTTGVAGEAKPSNNQTDKAQSKDVASQMPQNIKLYKDVLDSLEPWRRRDAFAALPTDVQYQLAGYYCDYVEYLEGMHP